MGQNSQETSQLAPGGPGVTRGPWGQPGEQVERGHQPGLGSGEEQRGTGVLELGERLKQKPGGQRLGCQETPGLPGLGREGLQ